jgi:hypothetical protein
MAKKPATTTKKAAKPKTAAKAAPASRASKDTKGTAKVAAKGGAKSAAAPITDTGGAQGQYVYCIIQSESPLTFGPLGIGHDPAEVHTVHFKDLAAVVSATA